MTLQEFEPLFKKITSRWPRSYSAEQVSLAYKAAQSIKVEDFEDIVNSLLASSRNAPMVVDIQAAARALGAKIGSYRGQESTRQTATPNGSRYKLRDNIFADNNYVYRQGHDVASSSFIIKRDSPDHPLVKEDKIFRAQGKHQLTENQDTRDYSVKFSGSLNFDSFTKVGA